MTVTDDDADYMTVTDDDDDDMTVTDDGDDMTVTDARGKGMMNERREKFRDCRILVRRKGDFARQQQLRAEVLG